MSGKVRKLNPSIETFLPGVIVFPKRGAAIFHNRVQILCREGTVDPNLMVLKPGADISAQFIRYKLIHFGLFNICDNSGVPQINNKHLYPLNFSYPCRKEQDRIAEILDAVDEAIARTESLIAKLKQMKAGLLHDLLTRGLDENGELRDAIAHPEQFKDSPLGQIPKEWEVAKIGEACSLIKDGSHLPPKRVENGVLLLSVQNMIDGHFQLTSSDTRVSWDFYNTMHKNWQIQVGDVLLAIVGATLGKTAVVPPMPPFTLQRSVAVLRGKLETLNNAFLHLYLSSEKFQQVIWQRVNQTAQPGIYLAELAAFYIPLPSPKEQRDITAVIEAENTRIRIEEAYRDKLKLQKKGLMHDLLTGRIRVEVKEN